MSRYRPIDPKPFRKIAGELPEPNYGDEPQQEWVSIADLVIDGDYQRTVLVKGARNIAKIAREFEWVKFAPAIVARISGRRYAVVDGQHRIIAACLRGIVKVPCLVINASEQKQAEAFAAINANITEMSSLQLYAARLAAQDHRAIKLDRICRACGVNICRYVVGSDKMKVGDTLAASQLQKLLDRYGSEVFGHALVCITKTGDGHPGLVRAQIVSALCMAISEHPTWRGQYLLNSFGSFDLGEEFNKARVDRVATKVGVSHLLSRAIEAHLKDQLDTCDASDAMEEVV